MANLQGYTQGAVGHMLNHYSRHDGDPHQEHYRYGNQKIDPSRTHLNYALYERPDPREFISRKVEEADTKPNKTTNVISDWVVTLPKNPRLKGREREFFEQAYEIVGLYDTFRLAGSKNGTGEIARNMFIVPTASVTAFDAENIGAFGAMNRYTTSFQIPNGTIDEYRTAYEQNVPESVRTHLQLTFDDNGYSEVVGGLENLRTAAIILFAAGLLSALAILVLLLYFFIVKQKKRTAIERSLGMSKNQCRMSLASGVVLLSAVAVILGTVCSSVLFDKVQTFDLTGQNEHTFSTEYSLWARDESAVETEDAKNTGVLEVVIPAAMILLTAGLSVILVNRNLKQEPIELLSARVE